MIRVCPSGTAVRVLRVSTRRTTLPLDALLTHLTSALDGALLTATVRESQLTTPTLLLLAQALKLLLRLGTTASLTGAGQPRRAGLIAESTASIGGACALAYAGRDALTDVVATGKALTAAAAVGRARVATVVRTGVVTADLSIALTEGLITLGDAATLEVGVTRAALAAPAIEQGRASVRGGSALGSQGGARRRFAGRIAALIRPAATAYLAIRTSTTVRAPSATTVVDP